MKMWMPGMLGLLDGADGTLDVRLLGTGEAQHDRLGHRLADAADRVVVALGGSGEAGLDDVDVQLLELAGDRDLLLDVHRGAGRLLAVAERRVEDLYVLGFVRFHRRTHPPENENSRMACLRQREHHHAVGGTACSIASFPLSRPAAPPAPCGLSAALGSTSPARRGRRA